MAAKPSPNPRMPRATSKSLISDRCGDVPSTRNLLETPSVAQSLDGRLRLKGSLRFPAVKFRLAMRSRASGARTADPLDRRSLLQERRPENAYALRARGERLDQSDFAEIVSQAETWPLLKPLENQRLRCSDVPWVKESGTT